VFLATTDGRDTFECLKEMGSDQEWSFGFRILGAEVPSDDERKQGARRILTKLDAFEVSPVIVGAGVGTRTTAVKGAPPEARSARSGDRSRSGGSGAGRGGAAGAADEATRHRRGMRPAVRRPPAGLPPVRSVRGR
jgi:hypothetical protein